MCVDDSSDGDSSKKPTKSKTTVKKTKAQPSCNKTSALSGTLVTPPPIAKPRGRGRPRKYPLPDPAQPKPCKKKKMATDVAKIVTRKRSQSSMSSRVSTLLSSINRDVTDTDSDTGM